MPSTSEILRSTNKAPPSDSSRQLTMLRLILQNLETQKCALEEIMSKCGRPLSSPNAPSTVLPHLHSPNSRAHSTSTSSRSIYPSRASSFDTTISSFSSTPCPWKDESFQQSQGRAETKETPSATPPQHESSEPSTSQTSMSHGGQRNDSAEKINDVAPLNPIPVKPNSSGIKPSYYQRSMDVTINNHQNIILDMAIVDVEIENLWLREWNLEVAEKRKKTGMFGRVRDKGEKERGGPTLRQRVEKVGTWPKTLEEMRNFF